MVIDRRIQRHQLTGFLGVLNRFTGKPIGYLGNVSEGGLMLISQLPLLVGADFELRLQVPGPDGELQLVDLTARCLWCIEDVSPQCYDSGFMLYQPLAQYLVLIDSLREYFSFLPLQASA